MESHAHAPHTHAKTLYVILQGEFVLYRERVEDSSHDILHIMAPYVAGHVYKAGPWHSDWKNLEELPRNTRLHLRHAVGDHKQFCSQSLKHHPRAIPERNTDLLMSCGPEAPDPSGARIHITAPVPLAILSGLAETTNNAVITFVPQNGCPVARHAPPHSAVILILLYKWYSPRPYLADEEDNYVAEPGGYSEDFQSLNIYASSPTPEDDPTHAKEAFHAAAKLLGETAYIDWPTDTRFHPLFATPPAGLTWAQVNWFLSDVIEHHGSPFLDSDFLDMHSLPSPLAESLFHGGQSTNCGAITGDDDGLDGN
jgi:hypothetical protein